MYINLHVTKNLGAMMIFCFVLLLQISQNIDGFGQNNSQSFKNS